jgi:hypothetical protein
MSRYIITVNRAGLDRGDNVAPILVEDVQYGGVKACREVLIVGSSIIKYGPELENGATVWIECDDYEVAPQAAPTQEQHEQEKENGGRTSNLDGRRSTDSPENSEA